MTGQTGEHTHAPPSQGRVLTADSRSTRRLGPRRLAVGACAALAAVLGGCTTLEEYVHNGFKVGPNYARPPAPIAADWIDAADVRVRKDCDFNALWWSYLHDPTLDGLIVTAYQQNLNLRQAAFRILQARARLGISVGEFFPQAQEFIGSYSRNKVSIEAANRAPQIAQWFSNWQGQFNLGWELDFWGRFRRAIEAADADLDASIENYDDVLVLLLADVGTAYVQIRTLQAQLEYTRAVAELQKQNLTIAQAKFRGGTASALDQDQAQSDLSQTLALIPTLEIQLRQANNTLCVLLGIPPRDLLPELGPAPIPSVSPEICIGIPAELLLRRPDIRRAERNAAARCAEIGVAVSDLYPHISVLGTIGLQAEHFPDLWKGNPAMIGSVGPAVQWKILNYGRLINQVRFQDARFQEAVVNYQQTVLQADAEVENALVAFLQLQDRVKNLADSVKASEDGVKVAVVNYREGRVPFVAVSTLQNALLAQQNLYAVARGDLAIAMIQVYRALGGGWQLRLEDGHGGLNGACGLPPLAAPGGRTAPTMPLPSQPETIPLPQPTPTNPSAPMSPPAGPPPSSSSAPPRFRGS